MDLWNDIVTAATLGAKRRPWAPPAAPGPLGALLARIDMADGEGGLLAAAAVVASYRRAGWLPPRDDRPAAPECASDDCPACGPRATARLATMLGGNHHAVLPEWLAALAAAGRRAPDALLPELLDLGRAQPELRKAILAVLGARGRWLAAQNPDWSYAGAEFSVLSFELETEQLNTQHSTLKTEWETSARAARLALLTEIRKTIPALARDMLASTWASEKAGDRAAFLAAFETGLSMDDEPFLEAALDDRGREVRRAAAALLARLTDSRLAGRMLERARPLLAWAPAGKPRMLGLRPGQPSRLDITLPNECDKALIRDGVEARVPAHRKNLGERAWWLLQIVSAIPPSAWSRAWRASPAELLQAAAAGEWKELLLEGWATAALAFHDAAWAEALLRADPTRTALLDALAPEQQDAFLIGLLRSERASLHKHPALALLRRRRHAWSAELARAVLRSVGQYLRAANNSYDYQVQSALADDFALHMPPEMLDEIAAALAGHGSARERWQGPIDRLLITLQFRRDMLGELRDE
jgi:hypothetical protein